MPRRPKREYIRNIPIMIYIKGAFSLHEFMCLTEHECVRM